MELLLAYAGIMLMTGLSFIGSAVGCTLSGHAVLGAMQKSPEKFGIFLALSALPSTQGLYGFVGYFMVRRHLLDTITAHQSYAILALGIMMGFVNYFSAIRQAQICANGIKQIGDGYNVFASTMVLAVFPEFYAILGLLVTIVVSGVI
ncbi:MAG: ATPase [Tannerella sp.]|jgi:V/A-type H+-transporting ATPase subunit K|nr:ATPase [Tannerella sp.]